MLGHLKLRHNVLELLLVFNILLTDDIIKKERKAKQRQGVQGATRKKRVVAKRVNRVIIGLSYLFRLDRYLLWMFADQYRIR